MESVLKKGDWVKKPVQIEGIAVWFRLVWCCEDIGDDTTRQCPSVPFRSTTLAPGLCMKEVVHQCYKELSNVA